MNAAQHQEVQGILNNVMSLKLPSLKQVARSVSVAQSGRKADIQDRIKRFIQIGVDNSDYARIFAIKELVLDLMSNRTPQNYEMLVRKYINENPNGWITNLAVTGHSAHSSQGSSQSASLKKPWLFFRENPFFALKKLVTPNAGACLKAPEGRGTGRVSFILNDTDLQTLKTSRTAKLLLLCGVYDKNKPTTDAYIEFPSPIEIHLNGIQVKDNVKGIKNKPGTTKPANLTPYVQANNSLEIVYAFTKVDYLVFCYIVEEVPAEKILAKVLANPRTLKQTTLDTFKTEADKDDDDDEIMEMGTRLSLKCPLSFQRMKYPVKSIYCSHLPCFDALSFIYLQEQSSTWACPVCNSPVKVKDLSLNEYVLDILKNTPDDCDTVEIGLDGSWTPLFEDDDGHYQKRENTAAASEPTTTTTSPPTANEQPPLPPVSSPVVNNELPATSDPQVLPSLNIPVVPEPRAPVTDTRLKTKSAPEPIVISLDSDDEDYEEYDTALTDPAATGDRVTNNTADVTSTTATTTHPPNAIPATIHPQIPQNPTPTVIHPQLNSTVNSPPIPLQSTAPIGSIPQLPHIRHLTGQEYSATGQSHTQLQSPSGSPNLAHAHPPQVDPSVHTPAQIRSIPPTQPALIVQQHAQAPVLMPTRLMQIPTHPQSTQNVNVHPQNQGQTAQERPAFAPQPQSQQANPIRTLSQPANSGTGNHSFDRANGSSGGPTLQFENTGGFDGQGLLRPLDSIRSWKHSSSNDMNGQTSNGEATAQAAGQESRPISVSSYVKEKNELASLSKRLHEISQMHQSKARPDTTRSSSSSSLSSLSSKPGAPSNTSPIAIVPPPPIPPPHTINQPAPSSFIPPVSQSSLLSGKPKLPVPPIQPQPSAMHVSRRTSSTSDDHVPKPSAPISTSAEPLIGRADTEAPPIVPQLTSPLLSNPLIQPINVRPLGPVIPMKRVSSNPNVSTAAQSELKTNLDSYSERTGIARANTLNTIHPTGSSNAMSYIQSLNNGLQRNRATPIDKTSGTPVTAPQLQPESNGGNGNTRAQSFSPTRFTDPSRTTASNTSTIQAPPQAPVVPTGRNILGIKTPAPPVLPAPPALSKSSKPVAKAPNIFLPSKRPPHTQLERKRSSTDLPQQPTKKPATENGHDDPDDAPLIHR